MGFYLVWSICLHLIMLVALICYSSWSFHFYVWFIILLWLTQYCYMLPDVDLCIASCHQFDQVVNYDSWLPVISIWLTPSWLIIIALVLQLCRIYPWHWAYFHVGVEYYDACIERKWLPDRHEFLSSVGPMLLLLYASMDTKMLYMW